MGTQVRIRSDRFTAFRGIGMLALTLSVATPLATAQSGGFRSPGMPGRNLATGQTDRFTNSFNPAVGVMFDIVGDYTNVSGGSDDDGFDLNLRTGEMTLSSWVDPSLWAYGVIVYADEEVALEEGAMNYIGSGDSNFSLRGGRFFVDFGKQMQAHIHDLRTLDRPAVLRTYLGAELGGDGLQLDNWFATGESAVVRYSLGVFGSLVGEGHGHGDEEDSGEAEPFDGERKDLDELALTARLTGFADAGERGVFQAGLSARHVPEFGFEADGSAAAGGSEDGLSNTVLGLDLTYSWQSDTATNNWTFGGEALLLTGDIGGEIDDNALIGDPSDDTVDVLDDEAFGYYLFADHSWNQMHAIGAQWSWLEMPEDGAPEHSEVDLYYTRTLSDFQRLRFTVTSIDSDLDSDSTRFAVQWTGFIGPHTHGLNW